MSKISILIKQFMEEKDINQSELAKRTGITQSSLSDYINDKYKPKQDKIDLLAKAFEVSPAVFFEEPFQSANAVKEKESHYYIDIDTREIAQEIFENEELKALFDASRNATKEDLEITKNLLLSLKRKEKGED